MDTIGKYRQIIEHVLTKYSQIPEPYGQIEAYTIFDREGDHYLLMNVGWNRIRIHGAVIHVDIINGKCWIQYDGIEMGIVDELEAAGIPKEDIVLGFRPPEIRPYTGYAVS